MDAKLLARSKVLSLLCRGALLAALFAAALAMMNCGNTTVTGQFNNGMGTVNVSISDPPSCSAPPGDFESVFITIRSVQAHISATAGDNSSGWQELAPQLVTQPVQVDLLHLPANGACLLKQLGSNSLPAGDYQQIRLLLMPNTAPSGPVPAANACATLGNVFNCLMDNTGVHALDLSSEANTGLKVPPGQVLGGPIHVAAGQSVDINIDFNTCSSIVAMGNGGFRLKPTLTAGQVSPNNTGISGQVVDSVSLQPISGAQVALEMDDGTSTDRIVMQALTDSTGHFSFCPLPMGAVFDVVTDALTGSGTAYNATVLFHVPGGTNVGAIPVVAETGSPSGPGTINGTVTALNGMTGADIDASVIALQTVTLSGSNRALSIPLFQGSSSEIAVTSGATCPAGSPTGAFCADYSLILPASNPSVGTFSAGTTTFTAPASGDVLYGVEARAFRPLSDGGAICSPSSQSTNQDSASLPLKVAAGASVTAKRLDFTGCS